MTRNGDATLLLANTCRCGTHWCLAQRCCQGIPEVLLGFHRASVLGHCLDHCRMHQARVVRNVLHDYAHAVYVHSTVLLACKQTWEVNHLLPLLVGALSCAPMASLDLIMDLPAKKQVHSLAFTRHLRELSFEGLSFLPIKARPVPLSRPPPSLTAAQMLVYGVSHHLLLLDLTC